MTKKPAVMKTRIARRTGWNHGSDPPAGVDPDFTPDLPIHRFCKGKVRAKTLFRDSAPEQGPGTALQDRLLCRAVPGWKSPSAVMLPEIIFSRLPVERWLLMEVDCPGNNILGKTVDLSHIPYYPEQ